MNNLAHSIAAELAGKSCSIQILNDVSCGLSLLNMRASDSVLTDAPRFFCLHNDSINDFEVSYFGPEIYSGTLECDSYQVRSLLELQMTLEETQDLAKPHIILADLDHLGRDRETAVAMLSEFLEDADMWEEQAVICIHRDNTLWLDAHVSDSRIFRTGNTAEVHYVDFAPSTSVN